MAHVEVLSEREETSGWIFGIQVLDREGALHRLRLQLSWADYGLWSPSGADEPGAVAAAVVRFLLSRESAADLRPSMDASLVRRLHSDADETIPRFI